VKPESIGAATGFRDPKRKQKRTCREIPVQALFIETQLVSELTAVAGVAPATAEKPAPEALYRRTLFHGFYPPFLSRANHVGTGGY
jgi:hypothetical protein